VLLLLLIVGCSSNDKSPGAKGYHTFQRTKINLSNAQDQVDKTLAAMDQFQYSGNLNNQFDQYKAEVRKLEEFNKDANWRAQSMKENMDAYMTNWEREMETLTDPGIKASMAARRDAVRANFAQVSAGADEARGAFEPFLQDHQEIVKAMSINLSRPTLPGLQPAMQRAHVDGKTLKSKISAIQQQLNNIERGLGASGAAGT